MTTQSRALELAAMLCAECDHEFKVVKYSTALKAAAELRRLAAVEAKREELLKNEQAWKKQCDTLTHQVICCGVAASHPDATLTTQGAYADKWNSRQAEEVRTLRAERDALRAELERIRAAATKLHKVKGRFHTEQAYRALVQACGLTPKDPT